MQPGGPSAVAARLRVRAVRGSVLAAVVVAVLLANVLVWQATQAAFTATTGNPGNTMSGGTVSLTDNDGSDTLTLFNLSNLVPGDTNTACITVTYSGTLPALVNLYATTTGSGLGTYLNLTATRGTISSGSFGDCTNFVPDSTNYIGGGAGVIYNSTLAAFPATYGTSLDDPRTATVPEVWTTGETHSYKLQTVLQDNDSAQTKTATTAFTWQSANAGLYSELVRADGPASYWRMDEAAGTTATDAIGAANGTYTNGPTLNQTSGVKDAGTAVQFDGTNDVAGFGDVYDFAGTTPYSVEFWLSPTTANQNAWRDLVGKDTGSSTGWYFQLTPHTHGTPDRVYIARGGQNLTSSTALQVGSWYHVVGTYDGTTLRLYINGTLDISWASATSLANSATALTFGKGLASYYGGYVDEVAVYTYALSAQQVSEHYSAGRR